jgi:hypothetical protein
MQTDSDPHSPLYIYNGPANLQELERVNLTGAGIFFNGSYSLRDLRNVNFMGATIFINGQQMVISCSHYLDRSVQRLANPAHPVTSSSLTLPISPSTALSRTTP